MNREDFICVICKHSSMYHTSSVCDACVEKATFNESTGSLEKAIHEFKLDNLIYLEMKNKRRNENE